MGLVKLGGRLKLAGDYASPLLPQYLAPLAPNMLLRSLLPGFALQWLTALTLFLPVYDNYKQ
jgi:hypothetical protein